MSVPKWKIGHRSKISVDLRQIETVSEYVSHRKKKEKLFCACTKIKFSVLQYFFGERGALCPSKMSFGIRELPVFHG